MVLTNAPTLWHMWSTITNDPKDCIGRKQITYHQVQSRNEVFSLPNRLQVYIQPQRKSAEVVELSWRSLSPWVSGKIMSAGTIPFNAGDCKRATWLTIVSPGAWRHRDTSFPNKAFTCGDGLRSWIWVSAMKQVEISLIKDAIHEVESFVSMVLLEKAFPMGQIK